MKGTYTAFGSSNSSHNMYTIDLLLKFHSPTYICSYYHATCTHQPTSIVYNSGTTNSYEDAYLRTMYIRMYSYRKVQPPCFLLHSSSTKVRHYCIELSEFRYILVTNIHCNYHQLNNTSPYHHSNEHRSIIHLMNLLHHPTTTQHCIIIFRQGTTSSRLHGNLLK